MATTPFKLDPPLAPQGVQPRVHDIRETVGQEYIAENGANFYWPTPSTRVLDPTAWSVARRATPELFAEMSRDATIHKSVRILIGGVLTDDLQFASGATEEEAADETEFQFFTQVQTFAERVIKGLEDPIWRTLEMMMADGCEQGHSICESNWEERLDEPIHATGPRKKATSTSQQASSEARPGLFGRVFGTRKAAAGDVNADPNAPKKPGPKRRTKILDRPKVRLMPRNLKVKPFGSALFAIDAYLNVLGIIPAWTGRTNYNVLDVISRDKFLVFTVNPRNNDPRGISAYWPLIEWWSLKQTIPFNFRKYLSQEALPIPILELPQSAQGWYFAKGPDGKPVMEDGKPKFITAEESARITIENMYNGKGVVVPHDVTIKPYEGSSSKAKVFPESLNTIDGQMEGGFLMQRLAQSTSDTGSASTKGAEVQEGRLTDQFFWYKRILATMLLYDLIVVAIRVNLGVWAIPYLPIISLGDAEKRDWADDLKTISQAYFWGFIDDTMRAELCAWLGLPKPGPSRFETNGGAGVATPDANGNPVVQNPNRPDKQPDQKGRNDGNSTPKQPQKQGADDTRPRADYQAWLDSVWPGGTPRTFNSLDEAKTFIGGLRQNVKSHSTRVSTLGHHSRGRRGFVGNLFGRFAR